MSEESKKPNKAGKEVDISNIDWEKAKDYMAENPGLMPYAHSVSGALIKPEDTGKVKGRAVSAMHHQTDMQMGQLYEQMQTLANQAKAIKERVNISERIYLAEMSFEPIINHVYHLYRRENGKDVLSMVAPKEWGRSMPFANFVATMKLLADHTWEILEKGDQEA